MRKVTTFKGKNIQQQNQAQFMTVKQFLTKCGINVDQLPPVAVNFGNHLHVQNSDLNNSHNKSVSADSDQGEDDDSIGDYVSKYFSKKLTQQQIAHTTTTQTQGEGSGHDQYMTHSHNQPFVRENYQQECPITSFPMREVKQSINFVMAQDQNDNEDSDGQLSHNNRNYQPKTWKSDKSSFSFTNPLPKQNKKPIKGNKNPPQMYRYNEPPLLTKNAPSQTIRQIFSKYRLPNSLNYHLASNEQWQRKNKKGDYKLYYVLSKFPKIKQFKLNQKAIIKCCLQDHDIFVCMPTGGGKSLTFQTLTFMVKGVYLCVLPLVSLIYDQECQAKMLGIEVYSLTANSDQAQMRIMHAKLNHFQSNDNSILLLCTPEKLSLSQNFIQILQLLYHRNQLTRIIIDEVHCVSTWGKQFRKQYQNLSRLKQRFPKVPILALTATVTEEVKQQIIYHLGIVGCYYFQSSFNRPNLRYSVLPKTKTVMQDILKICQRHSKQSGIIYCLSRRECQQLSESLSLQGIKIAYYHADISDGEKKNIQDKWMRNEINVITATIAFGMGINKPDVRFVIHHTMSKSLENYYQESGRAGRDGSIAECIIFYRRSDKQGLLGMTLNNEYSTKENKEFSTKRLAQMIRYCEERYICRRLIQLQYLGEKNFDVNLCSRTCDNCQSDRQSKLYQCVQHGKLLIECLINIDKWNLNVSQNQLVSIVRNCADKKTKYKQQQIARAGYDFSSLQTRFRGWRAEDIQMMLLQFMTEDILTEKIIEMKLNSNKGGKNCNIVNLYIKCNLPKCKLFLDSVESFPIRKNFKKGIIKEENDSETDHEAISLQDYQYEDNRPLMDVDVQVKRQKYKNILADLFERDDES